MPLPAIGRADPGRVSIGFRNPVSSYDHPQSLQRNDFQIETPVPETSGVRSPRNWGRIFTPVHNDKIQMTSKRIFGRQDIKWDGLRLRLRTGGRLLATVEEDADWVGMYRVRLPGGYVTDMANLTRAKDAAIGLALNKLNSQEKGAEASPMRYFREALEASANPGTSCESNCVVCVFRDSKAAGRPTHWRLCLRPPYVPLWVST
jgi:hypothetical protein